MREYSATIMIDAPAEKVWEILTNAAGYPEWDPNMDRVEGTIAPGEKITAYTKLSPDRGFPVTVTEFVPNERMTWAGGMPLGLFKSVRTFALMPKNGRLEFLTHEQFSGLLLPVFGSSIPDLNPVFAVFAEGLKNQAEAN